MPAANCGNAGECLFSLARGLKCTPVWWLRLPELGEFTKKVCCVELNSLILLNFATQIKNPEIGLRLKPRI